MASPLVDKSLGYTISFPVSSFTAEVVDPTPPETSVEDIDTSHQGTTNWRTFMPGGLRDGGELAFTIHFNPDKDPETFVGVEETAIVLTFPSTATWTFAGYIKSYRPGTMTLDQKMEGEVTVKLSGDITVAAAV